MQNVQIYSVNPININWVHCTAGLHIRLLFDCLVVGWGYCLLLTTIPSLGKPPHICFSDGDHSNFES